MTIELIGAITLVFGLIGLFAPPSFMVYVFFGATLLGAAAAVIVDSLGGATIQPAHLLLGFLTVKLLGSRDTRAAIARAVAFGSPGFWLVITVGYAAITAYALPRLFQGETIAFAARAQGGSAPVPLAPTASNLTQTFYFIGNCVCFLVLFGFGTSESGRKCLGRAALMCVFLNLIFVALDIVTYATNTMEMMSFIRNSTYSVLADNQAAGGLRRVIGSFVEASSFSYWTLGYFALVTSLWLNGVATRLTLSLAVLSFAALVLSTSTTGYVGLAAYLAIQLGVSAHRFLSQPIRPQMMAFLVGLPAVFIIVVVAICLNDATYDYVADILDTLVLNKMSSGSGIERSSWNRQALQNFIDTYGFGVGNGSVRASSFPVAVIASLGFLGALTHALFLLRIWFNARVTAPPSAMRTAARSACLAWLIAATVSGAFIDLGLVFFAFAALACTEVPALRTRPAPARNAVPHRREIAIALD